MYILQGRYLKAVTSAKGALKDIRIKTLQGQKVVKVPKALRAIAKEEISLGDEVRIWVKSSAETKKTGPKKADEKKNRKTSEKHELIALQIIPLSPKRKIASFEAYQTTKDKPRRAKKLTVQLCQKKNCCKKGGDALWTAFEEAAQKAPYDSKNPPFKLEAVGCLGGCKNGPNIRLLPANVKYRSVKPSEVKKLISSQT